MVDFNFQELKDAAADPDNPLKSLVNAARERACNLYQQNPDFMVPFTAVDPTGVGEGLRGSYRQMLDNMCSDKPLPPAPTQQFSGGQCAGTEYQVNFRSGQNGVLNPGIASIILTGPIGSVGFRNSNGITQLGMSIGTTPPFGNFYPIIQGGVGTTQAQIAQWRAEIVSVSAVSGPDNCGNKPPGYPIKSLSPGDYGGITQYKDRGVLVPAPWKLPPLTLPRIPSLGFQPTLIVNIGAINVSFDFRGAKILPIEIAPDFDINIGPGSTNPNLPVKYPTSQDIDALSKKVDKLQEDLDELEKCTCYKLDGLVGEQIATKVQSARILGLSATRNKYCSVRLTIKPENRKSQIGGDAPDVEYAGWAWFGNNFGILSERMPIDADGKVFRNDGGYTSFNFTLYNGFKADAFSLSLPIEE